MIDESKELFNLTANPLKVKIFRETGTIKFLGYTCDRMKFHRSTEEIFKGLLYTEHPVVNLDVSMSRIFAYAYLGGASDPQFTHFVRYFSAAYDVQEFESHFTAEDVRKQKYVIGLEFQKRRRQVQEILDWRIPW